MDQKHLSSSIYVYAVKCQSRAGQRIWYAGEAMYPGKEESSPGRLEQRPWQPQPRIVLARGGLRRQLDTGRAELGRRGMWRHGTGAEGMLVADWLELACEGNWRTCYPRYSGDHLKIQYMTIDPSSFWQQG